MIVKVIIFLAFVFGIMLVFFNYLRNKQIEREADRRERLQEKQEQLMESLRAKKAKEQNTEE